MTRNEAIAEVRKFKIEQDAYAMLTGRPEWALRLDMIPPRMHGGIMRWVLFGTVPGHFLSAIIKHELFDAAGRADEENQRLLVEYVRFFVNSTPQDCHGPEALETWKGLYPA